MRIIVKNKQENYELNLQPITQLCGKNIQKKKFILNSLAKHFSSSKYMAYENDFVENILLDESVPGRNYFGVSVIKSREDLVTEFKLKKTGMLKNHLDYILSDFEQQVELDKIQMILNSIFDRINTEFLNGKSNLRFEFYEKNIFEMVQCSDIRVFDERCIEELCNFDLMTDYLKLIQEIQKNDNKKRMLIFENIDHLLSQAEYIDFMNQLKQLVCRYDLWCIVTSSIDGYVFIDDEFFSGIHCINDIVYDMPEYEETKQFMEFHYPINQQFEKEEFDEILMSAVHNIGINNRSYDLRGLILENVLIESTCIVPSKGNKITIPEINFLSK